jgi:hypothetical protein
MGTAIAEKREKYRMYTQRGGSGLGDLTTISRSRGNDEFALPTVMDWE